MGLFDKKYCDICGKEIKFLGNRKLDDGNMCKDCASKLSPWFSGRRHTSVAAIKRQLAYREANQIEVRNFMPTETIGYRWKIHFDDANRRFLVSSSRDFRSDNPDIISYEDVLGVEVTVDEEANEIFNEDSKGNEVSYDPPKFEYEYQFNVTIQVRNEFFDDINFELTDKRPDSPESGLYEEYVEMAKKICSKLNREFVDRRKEFDYYKHNKSEEQNDFWFCMKCGTKNDGKFCRACGAPKPVVGTNRFCPQCGAKITDSDTRFCPSCGQKL